MYEFLDGHDTGGNFMGSGDGDRVGNVGCLGSFAGCQFARDFPYWAACLRNNGTGGCRLGCRSWKDAIGIVGRPVLHFGNIGGCSGRSGGGHGTVGAVLGPVDGFGV